MSFVPETIYSELELSSYALNLGYVHTVTFSHRFLLFGSKLEFPWDCGTIQSHAKTLPCARSLKLHVAGINVFLSVSVDFKQVKRCRFMFRR